MCISAFRTMFLVLAVFPLGATSYAADRVETVYALTGARASADDAAAARLLTLARERKTIRVVATLDADTRLDPDERSASYRIQRSLLFAEQDRLAARVHLAPRRVRPVDRFETVPMLVLRVNEAELRRLLADARVSAVEFDPDVTPVLRLAEMRKITNIEYLWPAARANQGAGTTLVVVDNGIDGDFPSLAGRIVEERCVSGGKGCLDPKTQKLHALTYAEGKFAGWNCFDPPDETHARGSYCLPHGGYVTISAAASATQRYNATGFGPKLDIVFVRVDDRAFSPAIFAKAFEVGYAAGRKHDARILTTSIGVNGLRSETMCDGASKVVETVIRKIVVAGNVVVNSAGNDESSKEIDFPGCLSTVLSVSASTEATDAIAPFSDVNTIVDFAAPADSVMIFDPKSPLAGTSIAAPTVAATLALLHRAFPFRPMSEVVTALRCGSKYLNRPGTATSVPRIDAKAAYELLAEPKISVDREFKKPADLDTWVSGLGPWTVTSGGAAHTAKAPNSVSLLYTDFCFEDFVTEASVTSVANKPPTQSGTYFEVWVGFFLAFDPKGDLTLGDKAPIRGYELIVGKTTNVGSTPQRVGWVQRWDALYPVRDNKAAGESKGDFLCLNQAITAEPSAGVRLKMARSGRTMSFYINGKSLCKLDVGSERFKSIGVTAKVRSLGAPYNPASHTTRVDYIRSNSQ